jgi:hypothetical protein
LKKKKKEILHQPNQKVSVCIRCDTHSLLLNRTRRYWRLPVAWAQRKNARVPRRIPKFLSIKNARGAVGPKITVQHRVLLDYISWDHSSPALTVMFCNEGPYETKAALASLPCPSMSRHYVHFCIDVSMILPLMVGFDNSEEEDISTQIPSI